MNSIVQSIESNNARLEALEARLEAMEALMESMSDKVNAVLANMSKSSKGRHLGNSFKPGSHPIHRSIPVSKVRVGNIRDGDVGQRAASGGRKRCDPRVLQGLLSILDSLHPPS